MSRVMLPVSVCFIIYFCFTIYFFAICTNFLANQLYLIIPVLQSIKVQARILS